MLMSLFARITSLITALTAPSAEDPPDRGDVPGWVLITLMTAGLVVALWALAGEAFTTMFQDAMNKVRGAG